MIGRRLFKERFNPPLSRSSKLLDQIERFLHGSVEHQERTALFESQPNNLDTAHRPVF